MNRYSKHTTIALDLSSGLKNHCLEFELLVRLCELRMLGNGESEKA
jgi:hypothetical protein